MPSASQAAGPHRAHQPDLDWSQVRGSVDMLNLAAARITVAVQASDDPVESLGRAFTEMGVQDEGIDGEGCGREQGASANAGPILRRRGQAESNTQQGIVAFQFYGRQSQWTEYIRQALERRGELAGDTSRLCNPAEWRASQTSVRSRCSAREEQATLDALLQGAGAAEALEQVRQHLREGDTDDIELF